MSRVTTKVDKMDNYMKEYYKGINEKVNII